MPSSYDLNVFINCPFDDQYASLFDAILFAVYRCGFRPRCAMEMEDAGDNRMGKINKIIAECRFGIHDISRTELDRDNGLPRFNMPLELGIFLGAKIFGSKPQKTKNLLIFDKERYRYQKYISDIAGQDIKEHKNEPGTLIKCIRNSLNSSRISGPIVGAESIIKNYRKYQSTEPAIRKAMSLEIDDVTYADKTQMIEQWLKMTA